MRPVRVFGPLTNNSIIMSSNSIFNSVDIFSLVCWPHLHVHNCHCLLAMLLCHMVWGCISLTKKTPSTSYMVAGFSDQLNN